MNNELICRICLEEIDLESSSNILPCDCKTPVHDYCLVQWISKRPNKLKNRKFTACEICKVKYSTENLNLREVINLIENENNQRKSSNNSSKIACVLLCMLFFSFLFLMCLSPYAFCIQCNGNYSYLNVTTQNITNNY